MTATWSVAWQSFSGPVYSDRQIPLCCSHWLYIASLYYGTIFSQFFFRRHFKSLRRTVCGWEFWAILPKVITFSPLVWSLFWRRANDQFYAQHVLLSFCQFYHHIWDSFTRDPRCTQVSVGQRSWRLPGAPGQQFSTSGSKTVRYVVSMSNIVILASYRILRYLKKYRCVVYVLLADPWAGRAGSPSLVPSL